MARFVAGDPHEAVRAFLLRSLELSRPPAIRSDTGVTAVARLAALAGRDDEALAWLERGIHERELDAVYALRDPAFDTLRRLRRFSAIEAAVGAPRVSGNSRRPVTIG